MKNTGLFTFGSQELWSLPSFQCRRLPRLIWYEKFAISCFYSGLQNEEVIKFEQFVSCFQFQYNNRNQHYELPPSAKFHLYTLFYYQHIEIFMFSLSLKWWRHQILLILTTDLSFNTRIEISIISYPYMLTFNLLLPFLSKILAILWFPYLQNDDVIKFDQFCRLIQISTQ